MRGVGWVGVVREIFGVFDVRVFIFIFEVRGFFEFFREGLGFFFFVEGKLGMGFSSVLGVVRVLFLLRFEFGVGWGGVFSELKKEGLAFGVRV